jgi:hypothetical protein
MSSISLAGISIKARRAFTWLIMARGYGRYPVILRFLWFIMFLGIRTNGML